ncbi:MAG TPA: D-alanyl-D-alanine carboxypeptidase/D-alanyl-D-alanine-endopeptidase, partial [Bacteroidota bacterium]|nr:D-alanyl-D-alanine carboxypeptidase/D-alanyl-D-alanine-endopeptidase [Bacteroidota bacterium]
DDEPESDEPFITPLSVNGNSIRITVYPGLPGKAGSYAAIPLLESFGVENLSITTTDTNVIALNVLRPHGENRFIIQGRVNPSDTAAHFDVSVWRPEMFFLDLLKMSLAARGISVAGHEKIDSLDGKTILADFIHPIDSVLTHINKNSENLGAENLLKTLSSEKIGKPGTWNNGVLAVKNYLETTGVDTSDILLFDGSGVSFYNAISPDIIIKVLTDQYHRKKTFERFYSTLPIAGIDGTLKGRMKKPPTEGNVHAKTGTLTGVSALSGYVTTAAGHMLAFSILNNHSPRQSHELHELQDEIATLLAKLNY